MGQITEAFSKLMLERAREGKLTPLTAWEQAQFASAWLKLTAAPQPAQVEGPPVFYVKRDGSHGEYPAPRADEAVVTDEMVYRAARSLNDRNADECNVDREDSWKICGDSYREDARAALTAALQPEPRGTAQGGENGNV